MDEVFALAMKANEEHAIDIVVVIDLGAEGQWIDDFEFKRSTNRGFGLLDGRRTFVPFSTGCQFAKEVFCVTRVSFRKRGVCNVFLE